jgi:phage tail-like protein
MPRFKEANKNDPYRNFNFKILIDNVEVAACKKMSKLSAAVEVVKFRAGNSLSPAPELLPGRVTYDTITLENGLTNDKAFHDWAGLLITNAFMPVSRQIEPQFRKTLDIRVYDLDARTEVRAYTVFNAWVSKYTAMPDLVGDSNDVAIESIDICHEGWLRIDQNLV